MVVSDGDGYCIGCWRLLAAGLTEKVLGKSRMCRGAEMKSAPPAAAFGGSAASSASESGGVWCGDALVVG